MYKYRVELKDLQEGMTIEESVISSSGDQVNLMIVNEQTLVTEKIINILTRQNIKNVLISSPVKLDNYETDETEKITEEVTEEKVKIPLPEVEPVIDDALCDEIVTNIEQLFTSLSDGSNSEGVNMTTAYQMIENLDGALNQLVTSVTSDAGGVVHINNLKRYDEYTFHHSLSVAVLSIAIGQAIGLDEGELMELSRCAVLHDIGKMSIPKEIINKKGPLTDKEFEIIKTHATQSASLLKNNMLGDMTLWKNVMYHHEKFNGNGYPTGLRGTEIPLYSRIIAVADVYDAVTSYRPYRSPMAPSQTIDLISSEVSTSFDYTIVKAFFENLTLYPINTTVELSDGRIGVVADNENWLRPIIKLNCSGEFLDLLSIDNLTISIKKIFNSKYPEDS